MWKYVGVYDKAASIVSSLIQFVFGYYFQERLPINNLRYVDGTVITAESIEAELQ